MPGLRNAVASGNWSNSATWEFGLFPAAGDTVCANGFTVVVDQDVNVGTLTTAAQTRAIATPIMTSNTAPSGIVSASSVGAGAAWNVFDRNSGTYWFGTVNNSGWVSYEFPTPIAIDLYSFPAFRNDVYDPRDWTFEAWNGSSWIQLHSVTGITSGTSYTSPLLGNSTAYTRYRFNITATRGNQFPIIAEFNMFEYRYTSNGAAGGGFTITGSRNITCTNSTGISPGTTTCLTYSANSPEVSTITGNIYSSTTTNIIGINKSGTSTLNFVGIVDGNANNAITISNGVLNVIGTVRKTGNGISTVAILNIGGATTTVNITGNVEGLVSGGGNILVTVNLGSNATLNITGNVNGSNLNTVSSGVILPGSNSILNITGNVTGVAGNPTSTATIFSSSAFRLSIIGQIIAGTGGHALYSTNTSAIHLLSGPFICSSYGGFPYYVTRMHLIPTLNNYIEFRDNSTNGALSPGPIASASRMVSADTIIDAPLASNVRFGVSYGNGAFTGTCRIPSPSNVSLNVPFDTGSVGTAFLSSTDIAQMATNIWNIPTANLTGSNTIGARMANSSTVDTMGNQLVSLL